MDVRASLGLGERGLRSVLSLSRLNESLSSTVGCLDGLRRGWGGWSSSSLSSSDPPARNVARRSDSPRLLPFPYLMGALRSCESSSLSNSETS